MPVASKCKGAESGQQISLSTIQLKYMHILRCLVKTSFEVIIFLLLREVNQAYRKVILKTVLLYYLVCIMGQILLTQ